MMALVRRVLLLLAIGGGAFCLFLVQPLMAKRLLPWFGGGAEVWAVCLVFYQALLLGGYLYAHWLARRLRLATQGRLHMGLAALALGAAWLVPAPQGPGRGAAPAVEVLELLMQAIGLPYFLLSTTSPLVQHWYARLRPEARVYRLYAWSNLACLAALLAYPLWMEPRFALSSTLLFWRVAFSVVAVTLAALAWAVARARDNDPPVRTAQTLNQRARLEWFCLAALGSALLVALTNHLCREIAPFPFLWVVPLLAYLLSFVIVFGVESMTAWAPVAGIAGFSLVATGVWLQPQRLTDPGIPTLCFGLFFVCLFLHGELAARRPDPSHLTLFYIVMAAGGAAGSAFVGLVAPVIFSGSYELPLLLLAAGATLLVFHAGRRRLLDLALVAALASAFFSSGVLLRISLAGRIAAGRGFYGALRVVERPEGSAADIQRKLMHGTTVHGAQWVGAHALEPTSYYGPRSGVARALAYVPGARRVGVVGLGAGVLATFARDGDVFRFYEIDPLVVNFAQRYFSFLSSSRARVEVALGDARYVMERERPQEYDLLIVDAFAGDAIPVHLLTREAFQVYQRHLAPTGFLVLHVSNRSLNLLPVVRAVSESLGWRVVAVTDHGDASRALNPSVWVFAGPEPVLHPFLPAHDAPSPPARYLWTDERSSLLEVLR
jgi:hypothetical protein